MSGGSINICILYTINSEPSDALSYKETDVSLIDQSQMPACNVVVARRLNELILEGKSLQHIWKHKNQQHQQQVILDRDGRSGS